MARSCVHRCHKSVTLRSVPLCCSRTYVAVINAINIETIVVEILQCIILIVVPYI